MVKLSSTPAKNHAIYQNSDTRYISDFFNFSLTKMLVQKKSELIILSHITFLFLWGDMLKFSQNWSDPVQSCKWFKIFPFY